MATDEERHRATRYRQGVLDAVAGLQGRRSAIARRLADGLVTPGAQIVGVGGRGITQWMSDAVDSWRTLLSTRPVTTPAELGVSLPRNRQLIGDGLQMISVFDREGTEPAAHSLLATETLGTYLLGYTPVQMRLYDGRTVVLQGPDVGGEPSIMAVSTPVVLEAAWRYWHAVLADAVPASSAARVPTTLDGTALSPRQQQILELLFADLPDERVAQVLGVSVRTVRYEVAAVQELLGARSRFSLGFRYAELLDSVVRQVR